MTSHHSRFCVSQLRGSWLGRSLVAGVFLVVAGGWSRGYAADYSTPEKAFQTFLKAVKANDLAAAKRCWFISDSNELRVLDTVVGQWIAGRRLSATAKSKFTAKEMDLLKETGM